MSRAARRIFGFGLCVTMAALVWVAALVITEQNEGCNIYTCEVAK